MSKSRNEFLDHGISDESDLEDGYDSEAAEISKGARATESRSGVKRRKLSQSEDDEELEGSIGIEEAGNDSVNSSDAEDESQRSVQLKDNENGVHQITKTAEQDNKPQPSKSSKSQASPKQTTKPKKKAKDKKDTKPGVIYLSSLPPYLKPSALRNLLAQRGFTPITRLFLTPASKAKSASKKNSRQLYSEGWIEFAHKKTARECAESLNAQIVGGPKGGFYHDDMWNMKYLRGMSWDGLMAGIREERREEEGRRDEERRVIAQETKRFIEGVEEGKRVEGIKRKRSAKAGRDRTGDKAGLDRDDGVKRTWRQFEVKGRDKAGEGQRSERISDDVKEVLGKIF